MLFFLQECVIYMRSNVCMLTINLEFIKSHKQFPAYGIGTHSHTSHSHTQHMHAHTVHFHTENAYQTEGMLSRLLCLSTARCMPSVELTESVPMYVVIFKGIAPCPQLHTQVMQDKQPTHYKAHVLSGHGALTTYHTPS